MTDYEEIDAMKKIATALEPLDDAARARALQWALSRYRGSNGPIGGIGVSATRGLEAEREPKPGANSSPFGTFAELFDAACPSTERDKALVAAYWVQICQNDENFASQRLNTELKDLGRGIGNITEAINQARNERPALILQLKKSGISKQARKTYKLTQEGIRRVQSMTREGSTQLDSE